MKRDKNRPEMVELWRNGSVRLCGWVGPQKEIKGWWTWELWLDVPAVARYELLYCGGAKSRLVARVEALAAARRWARDVSMAVAKPPKEWES